MLLHRKTTFRGELRIEVTTDTLKCERRSISGRHSFEAPLSEVSPTFEHVSATAFQGYVYALLCLTLAALQYHPIEEISIWSYLWTVPLSLAAGYFFVAARRRSGDYSVLRSTKESSRDIWILRSGAEAEVDHFLAGLHAKLLSNRK